MPHPSVLIHADEKLILIDTGPRIYREEALCLHCQILINAAGNGLRATVMHIGDTVQSSVKLTILPVHGRSSPGPRSFRSRSTVVPVNIAVSVGPFQSLHNHDRRSVPFHSIMFAFL